MPSTMSSIARLLDAAALGDLAGTEELQKQSVPDIELEPVEQDSASGQTEADASALTAAIPSLRTTVAPTSRD